MKFPSESYSSASEKPNKWGGPCADSFCYASCNMAHCRSDLRLGKTPKEHNEALEKMKEEELEACISKIIERRKDAEENKLWVVHFVSGSSAHDFAIFNRKPTESELKTYIVEKFGDYAVEDNICYVSSWHVEECKVETPKDNPGVYKDIEWL